MLFSWISLCLSLTLSSKLSLSHSFVGVKREYHNYFPNSINPISSIMPSLIFRTTCTQQLQFLVKNGAILAYLSFVYFRSYFCQIQSVNANIVQRIKNQKRLVGPFCWNKAEFHFARIKTASVKMNFVDWKTYQATRGTGSTIRRLIESNFTWLLYFLQ